MSKKAPTRYYTAKSKAGGELLLIEAQNNVQVERHLGQRDYDIAIAETGDLPALIAAQPRIEKAKADQDTGNLDLPPA